MAKTGVRVGEDAAGERPGDQREDDQPAPVDPDADSEDAPERDARCHGWTYSRRFVPDTLGEPCRRYD